MKIPTTFLLAILFSQICYGQAADTVRVYDYLKPGDQWKLEIQPNNRFVLHTKPFLVKNEITITGRCEIGDSSIRFICDSSKHTNVYLAKRQSRKLSNISFILDGQPFPKQHDFFVPRNNCCISEDSMMMPTNTYTSYSRGNGFVSTVIKLKQDGTYIFYNHSCMAHFKEEGRWTLDGNMLAFSPKENKWSMLESITESRQLFLIGNHLVGKKVEKTITEKNKTIVTETFIFLPKQVKRPTN